MKGNESVGVSLSLSFHAVYIYVVFVRGIYVIKLNISLLMRSESCAIPGVDKTGLSRCSGATC